MILSEHVHHSCGLRVLSHERREQKRVLAPMMPIEGHAESVAEEQEVSRGVREISAGGGRILRGRKGEAEAGVRLE